MLVNTWAWTVLRPHRSVLGGLCGDKHTGKGMCRLKLTISVMKRIPERLKEVMNGLCPQRPGIAAPVDVMVLCKQREKIITTHALGSMACTAKTCTEGRRTRRQTKRHFHRSSMCSET